MAIHRSIQGIIFGIALTLCLLPRAFSGALANESGDSYTLGPGDEINVIVFGENDLSGTHKIGSNGRISLPLIGEITLNDLRTGQAEAKIEESLATGFLVDPDVSISIISHRPFYIMGEVRQPGGYAYINDMTALNAVALAGGFTYRANKKTVEIQKEGESETEALPIKTPVMPGDVVIVKERFF